MTRKMITLATVAAFGVSALGNAAFACGEKATKTASAKGASAQAASAGSCSKDAAATTTASASSCCAKATKTTTAGNVHKAMIKSAMVAPGASPVINTAAFAANLQGTTVSADCCKKGSAAAASMDGTVACDKGAAAKTAGTSKSCGSAVETAGAEKSTQTAAAAVDAVPYRENKRLVLTGTYACGHCGIGATAECSPMFKTADGKVYPLLDSERVSHLRDDNASGNVEISTIVKKIDGVKYLDVKSYKAL